MKNRRLCAAILVYCVLCFFVLGCGDGSKPECPDCSGPPRYDVFTIDFPSEHESIFAQGRDLYVRGTFSSQMMAPGDILIKLFLGTSPGGRVIRLIRSHVDNVTGVTPPKDIESGYTSGKTWGDIDVTKVTDLIKTPGTLRTPGNKVMVTNSFYAGILFGGVTKGFDCDYVSLEGEPLEDLTSGEYLITVTGLSGDAKDGFASKVIRFGSAPKLFGRFDPPAHFARLQDYAHSKGLRIFTDLFPGYFKVDLSGSPTYEIGNRWRPNNAIEVVNPAAPYGNVADGDISLILYNIKPTSATQQLEIGTLLWHELIDTSHVTLLTYNIGEPTLTYVGKDESSHRVVGHLIPLTPGKKLMVLRTETNAPDMDDDNIWSDTDLTPKDVDLPVDDSLQVTVGEELELFGVVAPIPTTVQPVPDYPATYTADNFLARIHYSFKSQDSTEVLEATKVIGLQRTLGQDSPRLSMYEFKHDFVLTLPSGTYTVELTGLDRLGRSVPSATSTLRLVVSP